MKKLTLLMLLSLCLCFSMTTFAEGNSEETEASTEGTTGTEGENEIPTEPTSTKYQITYHLDGGTNADENLAEVDNATEFELAAPAKTGYIFMGWFTDENLTEESAITSIAAGNTESVTLYAKWETRKFTITYTIEDGDVFDVEDGEELYKPDSFTVEDEFDLPTVSREGYIFMGWTTDSSGDSVITRVKYGTCQNLSLTPVFEVANVSFTINGLVYLLDFGGAYLQRGEYSGDVVIPETVEHNEIVYNVVGIADDAFSGSTSVTSLTIPSTITDVGTEVLADCSNLTNLIIYSTDLGLDIGVPESVNVKCYYDSVVAGEYMENGFTGKLEYFTSTIKLNLNGGSYLYDSIEYPLGSIFYLPELERDGYKFMGWYIDPEFAESSALDSGRFCQETEGDVEVYARWRKTKFSITYNLDGGTNAQCNVSSYEYGIGLSLASPTKDGYRFDGWYEDAEYKIPIRRITVAAEKDYVLYAKWTKLGDSTVENGESIGKYNITYVLDGGTNAEDNPTTFSGEQNIVLKSPTRKGYKFLYWCTNQELTNKITTIYAGTNNDITVYAKWQKVTVKKVNLKNAINKKGKKLYIKYTKISGVSGYEVQYSTTKKFSKKKATLKSVSKKKSTCTIKKLKKKKTYYVRVRAYKVDSTDAKVYGKWSKVKKVKIKK